MQLRKLYYLLLILPLLFINPACSDDDTTTDPPVVVNEAEVLVEYLEASGAVINTFPQMITAN
ncbi:MAG: hypothetical protein KAQ90_09240, partial [Melioribacteraceae bacterium]|nr:hypothetical protein [Melioribacteraceae bacterium]